MKNTIEKQKKTDKLKKAKDCFLTTFLGSHDLSAVFQTKHFLLKI